MSRPIIEVENLSKRYRLGQFNAQTMREEVEQFFQRLRGKAKASSGEGSEFWALKDVSFNVQPGEVVGIIGRNGAGKSTLLKILSRVTEPTSGQARIRGRVASLLEVGTGFHAELTGRENIFLNGTILGMTRAEVKAKFDEIVAFAEVEQFLDTPVKRYSSGMYVRLAFAVAAQLEPEILIVDEVLAVGDAAFQQKCLAKMADVTRGGRTIIFVSHQLGAISNLCSRTIVLDRGQSSFIGDTRSAISHYLSKEHGAPLGTDLSTILPRSGSGKLRLQKLWTDRGV
jgi:lipopolysaccharide transport system ATP-binding protein